MKLLILYLFLKVLCAKEMWASDCFLDVQASYNKGMRDNTEDLLDDFDVSLLKDMLKELCEEKTAPITTKKNVVCKMAIYSADRVSEIGINNLPNEEAQKYIDEAHRHVSETPRSTAKLLIALNFFVYAFNSLFAEQSLKANASYAAADILLNVFDEKVQGIKYLRIAAAHGHVYARRALFEFFRDGKWVTKDAVQAFKYLKMLATSTSAEAYDLYNYGIALWHGVGIPKRDPVNAVTYMLRAAEKKAVLAYYYIGLWSLNGVQDTALNLDLNRAEHYLSLSAGAGIADAQFQLGLFYRNEAYSDGAIKYLTLAADQGHARAQALLGEIYLGFLPGVRVDVERAISLLKLSAAQNYETAQYNLAAIYSNAKYGVLDIEKAKNYLLEISDDAEAFFGLGHINFEQKNYADAQYYLGLAANLGHLDSMCELASMYQIGLGGTLNDRKAIQLYLKAAKYNHPYANFKLGQIYEFGWGVSPNVEEALSYYIKAFELGHFNALFGLIRSTKNQFQAEYFSQFLEDDDSQFFGAEKSSDEASSKYTFSKKNAKSLEREKKKEERLTRQLVAGQKNEAQRTYKNIEVYVPSEDVKQDILENQTRVKFLLSAFANGETRGHFHKLKNYNGLNCDAYSFRITQQKRLVLIILEGSLNSNENVKCIKILSAEGHYKKLPQGFNKPGILLEW